MKNTARGLTLIFISEIMDIISIILSVIVTTNLGSTAARISSMVLSVVSFVMCVIGLVLSGRDEEVFKKCITVEVAAFVSHFVTLILGALGVVWDNGSANFLVVLFDTIVTLYIMKGIKNIYEKSNVPFKLGKTTTIVVITTTALAVVLMLWGRSVIVLTYISPVVALGVMFAYGILLIIGHIFYFICLVKTAVLCRRY